ncbi:target of EGR1 protein 1 [Trichomycterus rosablanca]|uniref:target of EGR1 protein 1 n=1 Tax=Trichomycterus rosablanca TaxID=2290929 RepID=UPI002F35756C
MSSSLVVPVIDVQSNNFKELWPAMVLSFKTASFIALDTELSGLGSRKALLAESIEDRYKAICHAARTRSILSLGIACYKKLSEKAESTYLVQVYNLTLLCAEEYIIEPQSVKFLVQHGFDFNKQYAQGVPYDKGNDKGGDAHGTTMRTIFTELLRANKPLVVHNGLIDMVFLYQCFYAHLPERLGTFTADLSDMFPAGIYDTKYSTEYELRFTASYLEYAYKKCKLENGRWIEAGRDGPGVFLEFCSYSGRLQSYVDFRPCVDGSDHDGSLNVCAQFSAYGWCPNGAQCHMSHDTDLIIRQDEKNKEDKKRKRKRRKKKQRAEEEEEAEDGTSQDKRARLVDQEDPEQKVQDAQDVQEASMEQNVQPSGNKSDAPPAPDANGREKKAEGGTHRAGFDAFMTGYVFAFTSARRETSEEPGEHAWIPGCQNKLYLSGKCVPLHVAKSSFSRSSRAHVVKMEQVWGKRIPENSAGKAD